MPGPYDIRLSRRASADLDAINAFIANDSPSNAAIVIERLLAAIAALDRFPHRTVFERSDRRFLSPVRTMPVNPYVIYFRVLEDVKLIQILTIRHGARRRPGGFGAK